MDARQRAKLERYFRNSTRFMWGLPRQNQKEAYAWLHYKGFDFDTGSYSHVSAQLIQKYGVERIIDDLVVPCVKGLFSDEALSFLRGCWNTGVRPDMAFLTTYRIEDASPFLEVNSQYNYVEGWGEFAGLWFEEISASS